MTDQPSGPHTRARIVLISATARVLSLLAGLFVASAPQRTMTAPPDGHSAPAAPAYPGSPGNPFPPFAGGFGKWPDNQYVH